MVKEIVTTYRDDLDGSELSEDFRPTRFSLDGTEYEIDLSDGNIDKLREALAPFVDVARQVQPRLQGTNPARSTSAAPRRRGTPTDSSRLAEIRTWANQNGYPTGDRGRIRQEIIDAYDAAH
jgi:hypothetical protein